MGVGIIRAAIVAATFNRSVVGAMIAAAEAELERAGATLTLAREVPGSYEVPLIMDTVLARSDVDMAVVLGFIERGETLHGEVMGNVVHTALLELQLKHGKPIGLGIIGPGATIAQAQSRKEDYARAAVRAALQSLAVKRDLAV
jgi:6,7-dimethyl-8-ribityllumazine synthase